MDQEWEHRCLALAEAAAGNLAEAVGEAPDQAGVDLAQEQYERLLKNSSVGKSIPTQSDSDTL